jgi:outer membrane immunogenic protein
MRVPRPVYRPCVGLELGKFMRGGKFTRLVHNGRTLLAAALSLAGTIAAAPAVAADIATTPVYKAPPVAPLHNWTGFYIGGNAGYAWGDANTTLTGAEQNFVVGYFEFVNAAGTRSFDPSSFTGGAQAGYNWQAGRVVFGVEADFNFMRLNESLNLQFSGTPAFPTAPFAVLTEFSTSWLATGRGRLGIAHNNVLIYGTGGIAITNLEFTQFFTRPNVAGATATASTSKTKVGWTAGGGVEWGWTNNWSVKAEYLYVDLGSETAYSVLGPGFGDPTRRWAHTIDLSTHIARVGLNYKFN